MSPIRRLADLLTGWLVMQIAAPRAGADSPRLPSGSDGILSGSNSSLAPAFVATTGRDFASGLGRENAADLIAGRESAILVLTGSGGPNSGGPLSHTLKVSDRGPLAASSITVTAMLPSGIALVSAPSSAGCTLSGEVLTCTVDSLALSGIAISVVILQPSNSSAAQLSLRASACDVDADPGDEIATFALNLAANPLDTDGPMPLWAPRSRARHG